MGEEEMVGGGRDDLRVLRGLTPRVLYNSYNL